jgi:hypothetical protein
VNAPAHVVEPSGGALKDVKAGMQSDVLASPVAVATVLMHSKSDGQPVPPAGGGVDGAVALGAGGAVLELDGGGAVTGGGTPPVDDVPSYGLLAPEPLA